MDVLSTGARLAVKAEPVKPYREHPDDPSKPRLGIDSRTNLLSGTEFIQHHPNPFKSTQAWPAHSGFRSASVPAPLPQDSASTHCPPGPPGITTVGITSKVALQYQPAEVGSDTLSADHKRAWGNLNDPGRSPGCAHTLCQSAQVLCYQNMSRSH